MKDQRIVEHRRLTLAYLDASRYNEYILVNPWKGVVQWERNLVGFCVKSTAKRCN